MRMKVPPEVAEAFQYHENQWKNMSKDSINLMFMAIPCTTVHGKALVLKNFAQRNPSVYLYALVNGYVPEIDTERELTEMITAWLDKPYVGNEKRDISDFARMVVKYFERKNG